MGLFTQRPEENDEWAGLPSEPLLPPSAAERLDGLTPEAVGPAGLLADDGAIASISIDIAPTVPAESETDPA